MRVRGMQIKHSPHSPEKGLIRQRSENTCMDEGFQYILMSPLMIQSHFPVAKHDVFTAFFCLTQFYNDMKHKTQQILTAVRSCNMQVLVSE